MNNWRSCTLGRGSNQYKGQVTEARRDGTWVVADTVGKAIAKSHSICEFCESLGFVSEWGAESLEDSELKHNFFGVVCQQNWFVGFLWRRQTVKGYHGYGSFNKS